MPNCLLKIKHTGYKTDFHLKITGSKIRGVSIALRPVLLHNISFLGENTDLYSCLHMHKVPWDECQYDPKWPKASEWFSRKVLCPNIHVLYPAPHRRHVSRCCDFLFFLRISSLRNSNYFPGSEPLKNVANQTCLNVSNLNKKRISATKHSLF